MERLRRALATHLASSHVARVTYGAIIGLALVVGLEAHPPGAGAVMALLLGTGVAVALAELYSEILGAEARNRRHVERREVAHMLDDSVAVWFGVSFPAVFFGLAELGLMETETAFTIAKWSGVGLIAFYGFCAGRLAGAGYTRSLVQGLAVALIGGALIALKSILH